MGLLSDKKLPYPYKMFWTRYDLLAWYLYLREHHSCIFLSLSPCPPPPPPPPPPPLPSPSLSLSHTHTYTRTHARTHVPFNCCGTSNKTRNFARCCCNSLVDEINEGPKDECNGVEEAATPQVWIMVAINGTSRSTWLITQDNVVDNDVGINLLANICLCNKILYFLISWHYAMHISYFLI